MKTLFTPWRYAYITEKEPEPGCFFCAAVEDRNNPERLVVHWARHHLVMLNRHPYTNGHLMVAPLEHVADPVECASEVREELWPVVLEARQVLTEAYSPDGFNLGMNLGVAGGAGVPGHYHFHIVPRWSGDTNFMGSVAGVRLVPEALDDSWRRLRERFQDSEER